MGNLVKTSMLLAAMTALFMGVGYLIGGETGMIMALVVAAATNVFGWWNSGNMVLRIHGAQEVDEAAAPELVSMVRQLAERAELPMPRVYIIDTAQPNAFATGRNPQNSAVAASTGLLNALSREEIAAVMAHELAHIKNRDTLTMTITATLAGAISMLTNFAFFFRGRNSPFGMIGTLAAMILAPMAAGIVQMAISRSREYEADKDGAIICGNPLWLATALEKISAMSGRVINQQAENAPATAHMFIINPLNGERADPLFSTHPDPVNRIAALQELHDQWNSRPPTDVVTTQGRQAEREIFGRNAGQLRQSKTDAFAKTGPWGDPSSHQREPWG